jgi:hypothetical protein
MTLADGPAYHSSTLLTRSDRMKKGEKLFLDFSKISCRKAQGIEGSTRKSIDTSVELNDNGLCRNTPAFVACHRCSGSDSSCTVRHRRSVAAGREREEVEQVSSHTCANERATYPTRCLISTIVWPTTNGEFWTKSTVFLHPNSSRSLSWE